MNDSPSSPVIRIVLLNGPRIGDGFAVPVDGGYIGRSRGSLARLDRKAHWLVSGRHVGLSLQSGEWWVEDLDSTNGTWRNGVRLAGRASLDPDDEFELGRPGLDGTLRFYVTFIERRRAFFGLAAE